MYSQLSLLGVFASFFFRPISIELNVVTILLHFDGGHLLVFASLALVSWFTAIDLRLTFPSAHLVLFTCYN